jgi:hypothetical protein
MFMLFRYKKIYEGCAEKFVDWRQCAAVMQREAYKHNSGAMLPVHELFKLYNDG